MTWATWRAWPLATAGGDDLGAAWDAQLGPDGGDAVVFDQDVADGVLAVERAGQGAAPDEQLWHGHSIGARRLCRSWVRQADLDDGRRSDGLRSTERGELRRLLAESCFAMLECELVARGRGWTPTEARMAVLDCVESFSSPRRRHSALAYRSPAEYERRHQTRSAAV